MEKSQVPAHTHVLLQALFYSNPGFVSFTETNDEISLILDEETHKLFPQTGINMSEQPFRAIQFTLGASPLESGGYVSEIAGPLARAGVSIFFFTTFNTDLILVEESKFNIAKKCIKANFSTVWTEDTSVDSSTDVSTQPTEGPSNIRAETFKKLKAFPQLPLVLTCINPEKFHECTRYLIELLFFPKSGSRFVSFTVTEEEISLILDTTSLSTFPSDHLETILNETTWIPIRRVHKEGFSETGVVSAISAPLSKMSLLYLSSFKTAWFTVPKDDFSAAVSKLEETGFIVVQTDEPEP